MSKLFVNLNFKFTVLVEMFVQGVKSPFYFVMTAFHNEFNWIYPNLNLSSSSLLRKMASKAGKDPALLN